MQRKLSEKLSFFFEQIGGYGDKSEVAQVSAILAIDLSVFQDYDYGTEDLIEEKTYWKDINTFINTVEALITKIQITPNYYTHVQHNLNYFYPADSGYLSSGQIVKDLKILRQILDCYQTNGVTKIKLMYM